MERDHKGVLFHSTVNKYIPEPIWIATACAFMEWRNDHRHYNDSLYCYHSINRHFYSNIRVANITWLVWPDEDARSTSENRGITIVMISSVNQPEFINDSFATMKHLKFLTLKRIIEWMKMRKSWLWLNCLRLSNICAVANDKPSSWHIVGTSESVHQVQLRILICI